MRSFRRSRPRLNTSGRDKTSRGDGDSMTSDLLTALSRSPGLSVLFKATILIAMALIATQLARRARASVRHLIWAAAFAALLVLPVIIAIGPQIRITVATASSAPVKQLPDTPIAARTGQAAAMTSDAHESWTPTWIGFLGVVWLAGVMAHLTVLGRQLLRLRRLRRLGVPWLEGDSVVRTMARAHGFQRPIEVSLHEGVTAPITCGVFHPVLLLPFDVRSWSTDDLDR